MRRALRRGLRLILLAALALVLGYEEVQWRFSIVFAWLGSLPLLRNMEAWARGLPPYGALALFLIPSAIVLPIKVLALFWLAAGKKILALGSIFAAKIVGTALVARIFQLTKTALLTIGFFAWTYRRVMVLREAAYGIWRSLPVVRWWRMRKSGMLARLWAALRSKNARESERHC